MSLLLGTKGNDILQWRASAELVTALEGKLAQKWEQSSSGEAERFLATFIGTLRDELGYEIQLSDELAALEEGIDGTAAPGEMLPLQARYLEVVSAHFRRRKSVLALCELCNQLHDRVLAKALAFASERMLQLGQGCAPACALLVSGDRGRREQTLHSNNRYFLLFREQDPRASQFRRQVGAALQEVGLPGADQMLWHGSFGEWRSFLGGTLARGENVPPGNILAPLPLCRPAQADR